MDTRIDVSSSGGRGRARRRLLQAAVLACVATVATAARAETPDTSQVTVQESRGVFSVAASFTVPQAPAAVLAVLTDYEGLARVIPDITRSVVRSRVAERALVEQEAVSRVLFFSRTVHLMLEVHEQRDALTFRDVCRRSFTVYEGAWRVTAVAGGTRVAYELRAQPAFDVPDFLVKRLFRRDADRLIARLRQAISS